MALEYKPSASRDFPVDPNRCKALVLGDVWWSRQCLRKPWKDGWCKQHHPDSVAEREKQRTLEYERRQRNSVYAQLGGALEKIKMLETRIDKALAMIYATPQGWAAPVLEDAIHEIRMILEGKSDER